MRSRKRPLNSNRLTAWCVAAVLIVSLVFSSGRAAVASPPDDPLKEPPVIEKYTVQLGTFKTVSAMHDLYLQVPVKYHKKTLVCHSGIHYTLRCTSSAKKEDIDQVYKKLNDLGLKPVIVKANLGDCSRADTFFKTYAKEKATSELPSLKQPRRTTRKEGVYGDLLDPKVKSYLKKGEMAILPEVTTKVLLSNRDVNRITCLNGPIKDVIYSKEKGITVKTDGNNVFVKFLISRDPATGDMRYSKIPSEFYVVCGDEGTVYTLIAVPRDIPAQAVQLVSHKKEIKKNFSMFEGIPFEKKVLLLVKDTYRDRIPESFTVHYENKSLNIFREIDISLKRQVIADGEGLDVKEYVLTLKPTSVKTRMRLKEQFFLLPELAQKPVGIALEHMTLRKGRPARLFIVERHLDSATLPANK